MREMENYSHIAKEPEKQKIKIAIIENSDQVDATARDVADEKMTSSKEKLTGLKGRLKSFWVHNIAKSYYQKKETAIAKEQILKSGNVFVGEGGKSEHHEKMNSAIVQRFLSEYDEAIHDQAGEHREVIGKNEQDKVIEVKIKDLVMDYVEGKITDETFPEERTRILNDLKNSKNEVIEKGVMYADNLMEVARQLKQAKEHGEAVERLDLDFEVVVGRAKSGVRTEAQYDCVDRMTAKIMDSKLGCLVNETTVASSLAAVYSIGAAISQRVASSKLASWGTFGASALLGGGIAALRERKMLEDDRKQHFRQMAQGKKFNEEKSPRRKEMEVFRYETKDASTLACALGESLYETDKEGKSEIKKELSGAEIQAVFGQLAEIESRIHLSDLKKIDLISYTDVKNIEQERLELDLARAKAKIDLRKCADTEEMKAVLQGKSVDEFLSSVVETKNKQLTEGERGIEKKDNLFKDCKTKKTAKAFVKGIMTGLVVGAAAQEVMAFMNPQQTGMVENFFVRDSSAADLNGMPPTEHFTPLEYARRWTSQHLFGNSELPRMDMRNAHEAIIGATHVKLPQGVDLVQNNHGSYTLMQNGASINENITFDSNGNITPQSQAILQEQGINIKSTLGQGTPKEFIQHNTKATTHIQRDLWYENNTPKPIFDKNELKLWWGGHEGTGINEDGKYVFSVKHMTSGGSYEGNFSVDAQEAMNNGQLKMVFSLSQDTQNHVFECPIDASGNAIIDPNSEAGKLLFQNVDGHAKFVGRFAEVVQDMGTNNKGIDHVRVLATHIGHGLDQVVDPIAIFDMPAPYEMDAPWLIPAMGRIPLEPVAREKIRQESLGGYFFDKRQNIEKWKSSRSPRLLENPSAKLSQKEEIDWYFDQQKSKEGEAYINELESFVKKDSTLDSLSKDTKVVVCIPVAAAHEMENIYNTLELYSKQDEGSLAQATILMNVNWPNDAEKKDVLKTINEIERAKKDFGNVNIAYFTKEWSREWINSRNGQIYGTVVKYLNDTALLAIKKAEIKNDVFLLTNDADCRGISKTYLKNLIENASKNESKDAFLGKIEWGSETYDKYPGFHVSMRFIQYLDTIFRSSMGDRKNIASSGANFLCKSSMYAAVGGYDNDFGAGADTDLGSRIKSARSNDTFKFKEDEYPIKYLNSAWLDTDPSRALRYYKNGLPIIEMWNNFDEGGYEPRGDILLRDNQNENLINDAKIIKERIEFQLTETVNRWVGFHNKELYTRCLDILLPPNKGIKRWSMVGFGNDAKIKITDEGYLWLENRLSEFEKQRRKDTLYKNRGIRATL